MKAALPVSENSSFVKTGQYPLWYMMIQWEPFLVPTNTSTVQIGLAVSFTQYYTSEATEVYYNANWNLFHILFLPGKLAFQLSCYDDSMLKYLLVSKASNSVLIHTTFYTDTPHRAGKGNN